MVSKYKDSKKKKKVTAECFQTLALKKLKVSRMGEVHHLTPALFAAAAGTKAFLIGFDLHPGATKQRLEQRSWCLL